MPSRRALRASFLVLAPLALSTACATAPSPLVPLWAGSIGTPARGVLSDGVEVSGRSPGLRWLRRNDRHWADPRFAAVIERAAIRVLLERHESALAVGDLSARLGGGPL